MFAIIIFFIAEANCTEGEIRLVGTAGGYDGDVIICHLNVWGLICGNMWDNNDGMVACRQLGLEFFSVTSRSHYHDGKERDLFLVGNLSCTGSEKRLTDCDNNIFGTYSCQDRKAGLICDGKQFYAFVRQLYFVSEMFSSLVYIIVL